MVVGVILIAGQIAAQQSAVISGRVRSANGDALSGLEVRIYGTSARLVTDSGGNYRLDDIAPGEITLQVSGGGYMPQQRIITVKPGELSRQDFRIKVDPIVKTKNGRQ
jgi:iron complex outermembrane receptor protein